jgi:hypothetical protein
MDLSTVKSLTIPEGNVTALSINGKQAWSAVVGAFVLADGHLLATSDGNIFITKQEN